MGKDLLTLLFMYIMAILISFVIVFNIEMYETSIYGLCMLLFVTIMLAICFGIKKL